MDEDRAGLSSEIRMFLAEKRTSLSVLRTGLALFTIPVSVFTILIAASEHYSVMDIFYLFALLVCICVVLIALGTYLIVRSIRRFHAIDSRIKSLKENTSDIDV